MNTKKINFFNLSKQYSENKEVIINKINDVLDNQAYIGGHFVEEFEQNFAKYLNSKHAVSCNSGTDALLMALKALNLQQNEIVITTPFSFIASSSEIVTLGAHPVFIDINENNYNIDPTKINEWIKNECKQDNSGNLTHKKTDFKVVGILPVDIFGQCADYTKLRKIADKHNLWIVQDSCQAVGSIDKDGIMAGNHGDITAFSFYPTKNLGAFGDGGMCTTNNSELAEKLMRLRNHGRKSHYNYVEHGINSRLDGIQAAVLDEKLKLLDSFNNKRREIAATYHKELTNTNGIKLPTEDNGKHVYHQYCIELDGIDRSELQKQLAEKGIGSNIYYPKGLNQIEFLNSESKLTNNCPISDNLTQNILALPIWPELEKDEVLYICKNLKEILNDSSIQVEKIKSKSINI